MLFGRERECELVDRLLEGARVGRAGALLLRGEAGVGKSALLEYAAERADGMVVRALGVESEVELEFSALLEICRPLLGRLDNLPGRQAAALRGVLGLGPAQAVDPFLVGASTLSLLAAAAAEEGPLLVLVDDAQWLDRASAHALVFAARRLEADRVAFVFARARARRTGFGHPGSRRSSWRGSSERPRWRFSRRRHRCRLRPGSPPPCTRPRAAIRSPCASCPRS